LHAKVAPGEYKFASAYWQLVDRNMEFKKSRAGVVQWALSSDYITKHAQHSSTILFLFFCFECCGFYGGAPQLYRGLRRILKFQIQIQGAGAGGSPGLEFKWAGSGASPISLPDCDI
jgi:hypothetical protein